MLLKIKQPNFYVILLAKVFITFKNSQLSECCPAHAMRQAVTRFCTSTATAIKGPGLPSDCLGTTKTVTKPHLETLREMTTFI